MTPLKKTRSLLRGVKSVVHETQTLSFYCVLMYTGSNAIGAKIKPA